MDADRKRHFAQASLLSLFAAIAVNATAQSPVIGEEPSETQASGIRVRVLPGPNQDFEFQVDGALRAAWHAPEHSPRPFLYPLIGPSGQSVTRMGHPGAPDHDHHRSVWFAHFKVNGEDFWSENGGTKIRQSTWYCMEDGSHSARFACQLEWWSASDQLLLRQDVVFELSQLPNQETTLEVQTWLHPASSDDSVTLEKTNFGLFAIRLSKSISQAFGQGILTSDDQQQGEPLLFGETHRWVDYSGTSPRFEDGHVGEQEEGVTYFDHPDNPGYPNGWHVRADGWMCASPTMYRDIELQSESPLVLRYLLHVHNGPYNHERAEAQHRAFTQRAGWVIRKSERPHIRYEVVRETTN